jgi:hypothetical protein
VELTLERRPEVDSLGRADLSRLERLTLVRCPLDDAAATWLAGLRAPHLTHLAVIEARMGRAGACALAARPGLERLDLSDNAIGTRAVSAACRAAAPTLRRIIVDRGSAIDDPRVASPRPRPPPFRPPPFAFASDDEPDLRGITYEVYERMIAA